MSDTHQITPGVIHIPPPNPPEAFNPKDVIEAAGGTVSEKNKGFMPLTDFNPEKPYADMKAFVESRQQRIDASPLNPENVIAKIETQNRDAEEKREGYWRNRTEDWGKFYGDRTTDLMAHHSAVLALKDEKISELREKNKELKDENKALQGQHETDVDRRVTDLERYYADILALTEKVADAKIERLHHEYTRLDTERDNLRREQDTFNNDKNDWLRSIIDKVKAFKVSTLFTK